MMKQQAQDLTTWGTGEVISIEPVSEYDVENAYRDMVNNASWLEQAIEEHMAANVIEYRSECLYEAERTWRALSDIRQEQAEMVVA